MRVTWTIAGAALAAVAACSSGDKQAADTTTTAGGDSASAAAAATTTPTPAGGDTGAMAGDPDRNASGGSGVPAGYVGRTDREGVAISGAKYAATGGKWEVTTGPAHVVYATKDSARGTYTASATIEQLEAPRHPEAFGIFIGGRNLDQATQQYTYFLVRGGGEYLVKVREGGNTRNVVEWKASDAVPKADAAGKATYRLAAQVTGDSVRFTVNGKTVASVAKGSVPTDGIAGLRINHNLHVSVTPIEVKKS